MNVLELAKFYLSIQLISFIFLPLTVYFFRKLPDSGYFFSKPLALLVSSYIFWTTVSLHILPNQTITMAAVLIVAFIFLWPHFIKNNGYVTLRKKFRIIYFSEIFFLASFLAASYLRSFVPEILGTEKTFELMFLTSIQNSHFFPPSDGWYAAASMSYYYFGYIILTCVNLISRINVYILFNLGIISTFALAATSFFGFFYDLVCISHKESQIRLNRKIVGFTFLFLAILLFMGNWEGIVEILAAHGFGTFAFYQFFNIEGLSSAYHSLHWYPDQNWFWWRATRVSSNWNVMEFPFFSFLLGDLHPHVLILPYLGLFLAALLAFFKEDRLIYLRNFKSKPLPILIFGLILGSFIGINTWFYIPFLTFGAISIAIFNYKKLPERKSLLQSTLFILLIIIFSIISFLPILQNAHPAITGIAPLEVSNKAEFIPRDAVSSPIQQIVMFWGPLFSLVFIVFLFQKREKFMRVGFYSAALSLLPFFTWCLWIVLLRGELGLVRELISRGWSLTVEAILVLFLFFAIRNLSINLFNREKFDYKTISLISIVLGLLLIYGAELFYVVDAMQSRYNTVFKLYYNAWIFLSIGCTLGIYDIYINKLNYFRRKKILLLIVVVVICSASVYSVTALFSRTGNFGNYMTLDGLEYMKTQSPNQLAAIKWLTKNRKPGMLLEASGQDYTSDNFISAATGFPTVIGWIGSHEIQMRGNPVEAKTRESNVENLYKTGDLRFAQDLIEKYAIKYVFLSNNEQIKYNLSKEAREKFSILGKIIFRQEDLIIYQIN